VPACEESTQRPRRFLETFALFVAAQSLRRVSLALSLSLLSPRSLLRTGENFRRKPPPTVYLSPDDFSCARVLGAESVGELSRRESGQAARLSQFFRDDVRHWPKQRASVASRNSRRTRVDTVP